MKPFCVDFGLSPLEGFGRMIVYLDERIDSSAKLRDAGKAGPAQGLSGENAEPDLNLVEP